MIVKINRFPPKRTLKQMVSRQEEILKSKEAGNQNKRYQTGKGEDTETSTGDSDKQMDSPEVDQKEQDLDERKTQKIGQQRREDRSPGHAKGPRPFKAIHAE